ncbi:hypothetical protein LUZ61_019238 [Rhynchospora tenuis]|uniref:Uncharacterized protein n=1 Tax=Rhynchospora tenuis TaxID=198213 RepID=A0AAD5ZB18_9POAL|nr:hypothetical protein LUZ61_019238 [Rhynchospora tenuis]
MPLETPERCWHDDHTSTRFPESSGDPINKEKYQTDNHNPHKVCSLNQNSNPEKIGCKIPIILDKELIQPYSFNPDLTFFELIIKGLKNQKDHRINDLDEILRNDTSKKLVLDWMEAFLKEKTQPKIASKLRSENMATRSNKRQDSQVATYSSTNSSTSSDPSSSSTNNSSFCASTDTGLLHRVWHNGLPHFQFSIDGPDRVFVANPTKMKSEKNLALDYVYLFHEIGHAKRESTSRFVGNMRVSSRYILSPNESNCIETEFVLFGSKEDYDQEMQNSSSSLVKNKGLMSKVAEMLKPNLSPLPRYSHKTSKSMLCESSMIEGQISKNKQSGSTSSKIFESFPTNYELATIIVRDSKNNVVKKEPVTGGWGLKFLQKIETAKNSSTRRNINVLIPKGFHGGPAEPSAGPASLRERWSSGACDCGGWDLGCPITVFSNRNASDGLQHGEMHNNGPEDLFIEGVRHDEPALKLEIVNENVFMVHFQSNLSALQCFSIAVAIIHTQTPDLYPKL